MPIIPGDAPRLPGPASIRWVVVVLPEVPVTRALPPVPRMPRRRPRPALRAPNAVQDARGSAPARIAERSRWMVSAPSGSVKTATAPASSAVAMNWAPCTVDRQRGEEVAGNRVLGPQRDSADRTSGTPALRSGSEQSRPGNGATGPGYHARPQGTGHHRSLPSTPSKGGRVNAARRNHLIGASPTDRPAARRSAAGQAAVSVSIGPRVRREGRSRAAHQPAGDVVEQRRGRGWPECRLRYGWGRPS